MKVSVEEISSVKKSLQIEIPQEAVADEFNHALAHLQREAQWPGFRRGKVPLPLLLKKYGETLQEEVLRKLVPEYFQKAIEEVGLFPIESPQIQNIDFKKDAPLSFTTLIDVLPEIKQLNYTGLPVPQKEITVTEDDIEKGLGALQERQGYLEGLPDDHSIVLSDYVTIDFIGEVEGKPLKGGNGKGFPVWVGSQAVRPEIEEALLGKKKGDAFFVDVAISADDPEKKLAGKTAHFKIEIKEIKVKRLPALDDELAKDLGVASLVELKESVKTALAAERKAEVKKNQRSILMQKLIELHPMEVPRPMVEREWQSLSKETGISEESDAEHYPMLRGLAENRIKRALILGAIAEQEKMEALEDDVEEAIKGAALARGIPFEKGKREIMQNPHALRDLKGRIRLEKTLERIYSLARFEAIKEEVPC